MNTPTNITLTSSNRAVIARMFIKPERNLDLFLDSRSNANYEQLMFYFTNYLHYSEEDAEDLISNYYISLMTNVWPYEIVDGVKMNTSKQYVNDEDPSDQEFLRRVKNRLWSFVSTRQRSEKSKPEMESLERGTGSDSEETSYVPIAPDDTEREYIIRELFKDFLDELVYEIHNNFTPTQAAKLEATYLYLIQNESTSAEAIRATDISRTQFFETAPKMKSIINSLKDKYTTINL